LLRSYYTQTSPNFFSCAFFFFHEGEFVLDTDASNHGVGSFVSKTRWSRKNFFFFSRML